MVAMLRTPSDSITEETRKVNAYKDNLFDRLAINHLSKAFKKPQVHTLLSLCCSLFEGEDLLQLLIPLQDLVTTRVGMKAWLKQLLWLNTNLTLFSSKRLSSKLLTEPSPGQYFLS